MGAGRRDIVLLVLREGLIVTVVGIVIGLVLAFVFTRLIASQLYGVTPTDPLTMIVVVLLLTTIAMLACIIPARHAANAQPLRALRVE
jgi:ABC-type antimicrobial peptide transport system permease subunit